jgi:hypothetical protein
MMTMTSSIRVFVFASTVMSLVSVTAQQPATKNVQSTAPGAGAAVPEPSPGYSYDPAGRRDPFVSLLRRGSDTHATSSRPAGVPGLFIGEITVKGIVKDRSGFIAMVQGPDNKQTYIMRAGEKLMDGTVKAITSEAVVFSQDINDPLSMVKQKEIRKTIRSTDGGRG